MEWRKGVVVVCDSTITPHQQKTRASYTPSALCIYVRNQQWSEDTHLATTRMLFSRTAESNRSKDPECGLASYSATFPRVRGNGIEINGRDIASRLTMLDVFGNNCFLTIVFLWSMLENEWHRTLFVSIILHKNAFLIISKLKWNKSRIISLIFGEKLYLLTSFIGWIIFDLMVKSQKCIFNYLIVKLRNYEINGD